MTAAAEVTERFLEDRRLLVYQNLRFFAHADKPQTAMPMIVLVNHRSCAGAEIVAGALQDWGRAKLLGSQTCGRAVLQTVIPLADGSALRLATAKWFTPKGRFVHGRGLVPDLVVEARELRTTPSPTSEKDLAEADTQLAAAVDYPRPLLPRGR